MEASRLAAKDGSGTSDPYCVLYFGGGETELAAGRKAEELSWRTSVRARQPRARSREAWRP